jgi:hypothetical protein
VPGRPGLRSHFSFPQDDHERLLVERLSADGVGIEFAGGTNERVFFVTNVVAAGKAG